MSKLRGRISSAHVIAIASLFVALGSTAYALTRNEVKSKHIAPNAVKAGDVKDLVWKPLAANGNCDKISTESTAYRNPEAALDNQGMVHLRGAWINCTGAPMATLPAKYRPNKIVEQPMDNGGAPEVIFIETDGDLGYGGPNPGIKSMEGVLYGKR
jgi:hypothetical protein